MSDLDAKRPSRRLWVIAALSAVLLHGGAVAMAIVQMTGEESDGGLGASGIEVGLEFASPHLEATELPPGPDADASTASPAIAEQKAVEKETDLPKDVPTESETPDRVVTENESKKPKDEEPEKAAVQQTASTESVAAEATAQQTFDDAAEKEKAQAKNEGIARDKKPLSAQWARRLSAHLDAHKRYPTVKKAKAAKVKVTFTLDRQGHIVSSGIVQSSGDPVFDTEALAMLRRSDPVPKPEMTATEDQLTFTLDVAFTEPKK